MQRFWNFNSPLMSPTSPERLSLDQMSRHGGERSLLELSETASEYSKLHAQGRMSEAIRVMERGQALRSQIFSESSEDFLGGLDSLLSSYNVEACKLIRNGRLFEADVLLTKARNLLESYRDDERGVQMTASTFKNLGCLAKRQGKFTEALRYFRKSVAFETGLQNASKRANTLLIMTSIISEMQRHAEALSVASAALKCIKLYLETKGIDPLQRAELVPDSEIEPCCILALSLYHFGSQKQLTGDADGRFSCLDAVDILENVVGVESPTYRSIIGTLNPDGTLKSSGSARQTNSAIHLASSHEYSAASTPMRQAAVFPEMKKGPQTPSDSDGEEFSEFMSFIKKAGGTSAALPAQGSAARWIRTNAHGAEGQRLTRPDDKRRVVSRGRMRPRSAASESSISSLLSDDASSSVSGERSSVPAVEPGPILVSSEEAAAIVIQRYERGRRVRRRRREQTRTIAEDETRREADAALRIQALERGRKGRLRARTLREEQSLKEKAATKIQSVHRGTRVRKRQSLARTAKQQRLSDAAAIAIQRVEKGRRVRKQKQIQIHAAITLQRVYRSHMNRQEFRQVERRREAEERVQAETEDKDGADNIKAEEQITESDASTEAEETAARRVQRTWRQYQTICFFLRKIGEI